MPQGYAIHDSKNWTDFKVTDLWVAIRISIWIAPGWCLTTSLVSPPFPYSSDLFSDLKTPEDDDVDIEIECCGVSRQSEDKWGIEVGADGVRRESR